jgi:hypothetical protein
MLEKTGYDRESQLRALEDEGRNLQEKLRHLEKTASEADKNDIRVKLSLIQSKINSLKQ